jgi:hypothetical protein
MRSFALTLFFSFLTLSSCKFYSFTGASVSPDVKTITINYFPNHASTVNPSLSQTFTERLKEKFISQTNLTFKSDNGDLIFEGNITAYGTQPISIQGNETAALNRLTVSVFVRFMNLKDPKHNFEQTFTRFADYDSRQSFSAVEDGLVKQINEQLSDDIFNRSMINW